MRKSISKRIIVILSLTFISVLLILYPRLLDDQGQKRTPKEMLKDFTSWSAIKTNIASNIKLGLDLKGGSHLLMQVKVDDVIKLITNNTIRDIEDELKKADITAKSIISNKIGEIAIEFNDSTAISRIEDKLRNRVGSEWQVSNKNQNTLRFEMVETALAERRSQAVKQAMEIIENRVDALGVAEPTLQTHGRETAYRILLQLPGVDDPERVKKLIKAESKLELKAVIGQGMPFATKEEATKVAGTEGEVLPISSDDQEGFLIVEKNPIITGADMRDATAVVSQYSLDDYEINFSLNPAGAEHFGKWTAANIGRQLAIVLNGQIKSSPSIRERISDRGQITGNFSKESAEDLAFTLRSGALPAGIVYLEERTIGSSLGADSIRQGITASIAGLLFIMAFMIFYYRLSGVNAIIALLLNLLFLLTSLALFKATLTLPGIAGIILTIGMAVDSNVLIFERIREELEAGQKVMNAIEAGFEKAFLTIVDTHVTTVVSAFFLFIFGTGPIRGFAVSLVAGLLANIFTATYVSKTIFALWYGQGKRDSNNISI